MMHHSHGSGQNRGYHRVPTAGSVSQDDNFDPSTASQSSVHASEQSGAESLQQSLLLGGDEAPPQQRPQGMWHSPPQLHCLLETFLESWNFIFPYIRRMGNFLFAITLLTMLIVIPMVTYTAIEEQKFAYAAFDSAGVMVLGTLVLSFRLIYLHLSHWYMPEVQKYVVRIVWMVPLYAVQSWLSLKYRHSRVYIDAVRDLYEAFVIASFLYYLIELLGGQEALVRTLESKRQTQPHLGKHQWPLSYILDDWELGMEFMLQCKHGVLQYVVVKTIATILTYLFEMTNTYGEGEFSWNSAYPYMAFIMNMSVMYALYVLVMLFHAVNEELKHPINWQPLGKFLCVKGVVFFTWWQGVIIFYLKSKGFITDAGGWKGDEIANAVIDYCVCTEMVFFAIAHSYTFSYKEYLPSSIPPELRNLTANANIHATHNVTAPGGSSAPQPIRLEPRRSSSMTSLSSATLESHGLQPNYCPPAMLDRPLTFREAFWSSSVPRETFADIQRLRNGVDSIVRGDNLIGAISLQEIQSEADGVMAAATAAGNAAEAAAAAEVAAAASEAAQTGLPGLREESDVEQARQSR